MGSNNPIEEQNDTISSSFPMVKASPLEKVQISSIGLIGVTASINTGCSKNTYSFNHGVASGDPLKDKVILWTRVTPSQPGPIEVILEISERKNFSRIVFSKKLKTSSLKDYTIKYDFLASNYCDSDKGFFYRFRVGDVASEIGKSKTFSSNTLKAKIGIFSCSNYPAGYFNAYQAAAARNDLDLWIHLGDYLYEYPMGGYATTKAEKLGRVPSPLHEMITLADYRERHAQYKLDLGSQALHKNAPLIAVWDDHEFSNDTWKRGAENHSEDGAEGDFYSRRSAAIKAYYEWMPIREQKNKRKIFREFTIGKLIHLIMLDTRQYARDKQIQPKDYLGKSGFNQAKFYNDLNSNDRNLLGFEQLSWVKKRLHAANPNLRIILMSATISQTEETELVELFQDDNTILNPTIRFAQTRKDLYFHIERHLSTEDSAESLVDMLWHQRTKIPAEWYSDDADISGEFRPPLILYTPKKTDAKSVFLPLAETRFGDARTYTGDTSADRRENIRQEFVEDQFPCLIGTSAFGMGIDKPNVWTTAYLGMPFTLKGLYQAFGRAARRSNWGSTEKPWRSGVCFASIPQEWPRSYKSPLGMPKMIERMYDMFLHPETQILENGYIIIPIRKGLESTHWMPELRQDEIVIEIEEDIDDDTDIWKESILRPEQDPSELMSRLKRIKTLYKDRMWVLSCLQRTGRVEFMGVHASVLIENQREQRLREWKEEIRLSEVTVLP